jgi:hypothetical protein
VQADVANRLAVLRSKAVVLNGQGKKRWNNPSGMNNGDERK